MFKPAAVGLTSGRRVLHFFVTQMQSRKTHFFVEPRILCQLAVKTRRFHDSSSRTAEINITVDASQAAVLNDTEGLCHALEESKEVLALDEVSLLEAFVSAGAGGLEHLLMNPSQWPPLPETEEETKDSSSTTVESAKQANPEEELTWKDFCKYVVQVAAKQSQKEPRDWEEFTINVFGPSEDFVFPGSRYMKTTVNGTEINQDDMKNAIDAIQFSGWATVRVNFQDRIGRFPSFTRVEVDKFFKIVKGDIHKLETFLKETTEKPLDVESNVIKCDLEYVTTEPSNTVSCFNTDKIQGDKTWAVVIAGESGSGKSVYSCLQPQHWGFHTLYCLVRGADREHGTEREESLSMKTYRRKPTPEHAKLHLFLETIIKLTESFPVTYELEQLLERFFHIKKILNTSRDRWAVEMLHAVVQESLTKGDDDIEAWLNGEWDYECRPHKVAIVVDEATDIDLAEGLISTVRDTSLYYKRRLAKDSVLIIVAGTGLDALSRKYSDRIGTNPAYSKLIVVKKPDPARLLQDKKITGEVSHALEHGVFSRILKDNSRMLFRSVLPWLTRPEHLTDGCEESEKSERLRARLVEVGATRVLMDHAPRFFVNQNSIAGLAVSKREDLLKAAFVHHLHESVEGIAGGSAPHTIRAKEELQRIRDFDAYKRLQDGSIFSLGLARRKDTSKALKYLACFGLTCPMRAGFGNEFEELTALHYIRCMEVQGYRVRRMTLQHGWPPKRGKGDVAEAIASLDEVLDCQTEDLETLVLEEDGAFCFVFSQGTATAQGGDVLSLRLRREGGRVVEAAVDTIQCKHYAQSPGTKTVVEWWNSLGVDCETENLTPISGNAGYAYKGLSGFCSLLSKKVNYECKVGDRILACSFATPGERTVFPVPEGTRVWFGEMFEPTVSLVELRSTDGSPSQLGKRPSVDAAGSDNGLESPLIKR